ncbi:MAG TPA: Smr/MutS family protein [Candidatus Koribacter sp.]|jgi:hypothetical protein
MLKVINLEDGFPTVEQARQKMLRELQQARKNGHKVVKLIHGYGSTGAGGEIRLMVGRALQELKRSGEISDVIYGEDWAVTDGATWEQLKINPALKQDADLGRKNRGITIVWF